MLNSSALALAALTPPNFITIPHPTLPLTFAMIKGLPVGFTILVLGLPRWL